MVLGMAIFAAMLAIMATVALTGLHSVFIFEDKIMSHFWHCTIFNSMLEAAGKDEAAADTAVQNIMAICAALWASLRVCARRTRA